MPPETTAFFQTLVDDARRLDPTRPATLAGIMGCPTEWLDVCDFVMVNPATSAGTPTAVNWTQAEAVLDQELDALNAALGKPIIISEFGADTLPGHHADPPTLWSEEYQVEFLRRYLDVAARKPFIAGLHVWNMADFKTAQAIMRRRPEPQGRLHPRPPTQNGRPLPPQPLDTVNDKAKREPQMDTDEHRFFTSDLDFLFV
ncbi:MAG: hypothetical protein H6644_05540 [Caldilineaceae bacterium]|nr:hypothetical protein [Caldilineaceae bacterium]